MTIGLKAVFASLLLGVLLAGPANAVEPDEILKDPALEARARRISAELRCLVCQNQSIDDSNAPLARDLRVPVRERLLAGDTDAAVERFLVQRYGDFVLLRPPLAMSTVLLWVGPLLVLLSAVLAIFWQMRRRTGVPTTMEAPLSADEQAKLDAVLRADEKLRPDR